MNFACTQASIGGGLWEELNSFALAPQSLKSGHSMQTLKSFSAQTKNFNLSCIFVNSDTKRGIHDLKAVHRIAAVG